MFIVKYSELVHMAGMHSQARASSPYEHANKQEKDQNISTENCVFTAFENRCILLVKSNMKNV